MPTDWIIEEQLTTVSILSTLPLKSDENVQPKHQENKTIHGPFTGNLLGVFELNWDWSESYGSLLSMLVLSA